MRALATQPDRERAPDRPVLARAPANLARVRELQRTAGNRATRRLLQRQVVAAPAPKVAPGADENTITVELPDGARYRVTRRVRGRRVIDPGRLRADLCHDSKRVFLRVAWCQGTKGTIDVGANPQGALEDLLKKVGGDIMSGKGAQDVIRTVEDAQIQPFAEVDILRSKDWRLTGNVELDINRTGVLGGKAGVTFDKGWIKVRATGQAGQSGPGGTLTVEIPLGGQAPKAECPRQDVEFLWEYVCERESKGQVMWTPPPLQRHEDRDIRLYFDYETAELAGKGPTGAANADERSRLGELLGGGFAVKGIQGWTSPEGKRELPAGTTAGRFPGNQPLSTARAAKAREEAIAGCGMLRMRACADPSTPAEGKGEKLGLEADATGAPLERAVVDQFTRDPAELERLPEAERAFVTDEKVSVHRRAERIYPWLRRAEITLVKDWLQEFKPIPIDVTNFDKTGCPQAVENAADEHWGSRIPFTTPEPSICKSP